MNEKERLALLKKEGVKYDGGKLRYDLIPADCLEELAKIYTMGAQKYDDHNWRKGMKWSRPFAALMRHAWSWFKGEDIDPESGLPHLAHAAWNCFTLLNYSRSHPEYDDRIKNDGKETDISKQVAVDVYSSSGEFYGKRIIDPHNVDRDLYEGICSGYLQIKPACDEKENE